MPLIGRTGKLTATTVVTAPRGITATIFTPTATPEGRASDPRLLGPAGVGNPANMKPARMAQITGDPPLSFEFPFGLTNFSHDGGSVQYDEVGRPLQLPLLRASSAALHTVSFDFILAGRSDGMAAPVDDLIAVLHTFVAMDNSVIFVNVHQIMTSTVRSWKIESMSVSVERVNDGGQATLARVNMSCKESSESLDRFLSLPKFTYKQIKEKPGGGKTEEELHTLSKQELDDFLAGVKIGAKELTAADKAKIQKDISGLLRVNALVVQEFIEKYKVAGYTFSTPYGGGFGTAYQFLVAIQTDLKARGIATGFDVSKIPELTYKG